MVAAVAWREILSPSYALEVVPIDGSGTVIPGTAGIEAYLNPPPGDTSSWQASAWLPNRSKLAFVTLSNYNSSLIEAGAVVVDFVAGTLTVLPTDSIQYHRFHEVLPSNTGAFVALGTEDVGADPGEENVLRIFNLATNTQITTGLMLTDYWNDFSFNHDDSLIAVSVGSPAFAVYNTSDWSAVTLGTAFPVEAGLVRFSPDGSQCVVGGYASNFLAVYDTATWNYTLPTSQPSNSLVGGYTYNWFTSRFSANGAYFLGVVAPITWGGPRQFAVYDTSDWSLVRLWTSSDTLFDVTQVQDALVLDDGTVVMSLSESGGTQNVARLFDPVTNTEVGTGINLPSTDTTPYRLTPGGVARVTTGTTGEVTDADSLPKAVTVRLYDRTTGVMLAQTTSDASGQFDTADDNLPMRAYSELDVVLLDNSTPALNDLIYRLTP